MSSASAAPSSVRPPPSSTSSAPSSGDSSESPTGQNPRTNRKTPQAHPCGVFYSPSGLFSGARLLRAIEGGAGTRTRGARAGGATAAGRRPPRRGKRGGKHVSKRRLWACCVTSHGHGGVSYLLNRNHARRTAVRTAVRISITTFWTFLRDHRLTAVKTAPRVFRAGAPPLSSFSRNHRLRAVNGGTGRFRTETAASGRHATSRSSAPPSVAPPGSTHHIGITPR
jgi:hypothetical protein